jgi:hypothetical protein
VNILLQTQLESEIIKELLKSTKIIFEDIYLIKNKTKDYLCYQFLNLETQQRTKYYLEVLLNTENKAIVPSLRKTAPAALPLEEQLECLGKVSFTIPLGFKSSFRKVIL